MASAFKSTVQAMARHLGYQIVKLPAHGADPRTGRPAYQRTAPLATYAPWNLDADFLQVYAQVQRHTLVDLYRCWELWTLVGQSAKLAGAIIEVGVWRGGTGAIIAQKAALCRIEAPVYLCDTFRGVVKAGSNDPHYRGGEHDDTSRKAVEQLIFNRLGLSRVQILEGIFPDETAQLIEDSQARFRFCHIDVDAYQSAKDILDWVWPRLVPGGMVVYDDYGFHGCEGITRLVEEQAGERDRLVLHNLNGHAVVVKLDP